MKFVAFLRGINVGGKSMISMSDLKSCFETLGFTDVRTYINSGNVIFTTDGDERAFELSIEGALHKQFGMPIRAMVRSQADMQKLLASIPKSWLTATDHKYEFIFLTHQADKPDIIEQIVTRPEIEELRYVPGALVWFFNSASKTKSRVMKINQMPIYQQMSVRTSGTVHKLVELMQ